MIMSNADWMLYRGPLGFVRAKQTPRGNWIIVTQNEHIHERTNEEFHSEYILFDPFAESNRRTDILPQTPLDPVPLPDWPRRLL